MDKQGHRFALTLNYSEKGMYYIKAALDIINNPGKP
jgi:hypothetical protein